MIAGYGASQGWSHWLAVGVATGKNFPDALTGGVAMGELGGVLMVTTPDSLHADIRKQFVDHRAQIFDTEIFGGATALGLNVENEIRNILN